MKLLYKKTLLGLEFLMRTRFGGRYSQNGDSLTEKLQIRTSRANSGKASVAKLLIGKVSSNDNHLVVEYNLYYKVLIYLIIILLVA